MSRDQASSFDEKLFEEVQSSIDGLFPSPKSQGIMHPARAQELEDKEYGEYAQNADQENDQRILEMQLVLATKGWQYIVELWQKMIADAEREMKDEKLSDTETINKKRDWIALKKAIEKTIRAVEAAANTSLSGDLDVGH
jgi:hypothetical protein